ncbi:MAG: helix-turn-helix transcriptional regulator [Leptospirales bacterium]
MTELSLKDYRSILEIVNRLYRSPNRSSLFQELWEPLRNAFGIYSGVWIPADRLTRQFQVDGYQVFNCPPESVPTYLAHYSPMDPLEHGGWRHLLSNKVAQYSDFVSLFDFGDSEFTRDFLRHIQINNALDLTLGAQGDAIGNLGLHRQKTDPDFGPRERLMAELLAPHLASALHILSLKEEHEWFSQIGIVVMGSDGRVRFINPIASKMLAGQSLDTLPSSRLTAYPFLLKTESGVLRIRTLPLETIWNDLPVENLFDPHARAFLLEPFPSRKYLKDRWKGFYLTPRQEEVLLKVVQGDSNRMIADDLSITEQTVKDHIHDILEKLHVRNRSELITQLLEVGEETSGALSDGNPRIPTSR